MNSFQILNKYGNPLPINVLDIDAANFWNVEIQPKIYAAPKCAFGNWYNNIGWAIAQHQRLDYGINNWNSIKQYMLECHTGSFITMSPEEAGVSCCRVMRLLQPYFQLIDHWSSLGYTPKQITD